MVRLTYAVHRPSARSGLILAASLRDAGKIHPEGMLELGWDIQCNGTGASIGTCDGETGATFAQ